MALLLRRVSLPLIVALLDATAVTAQTPQPDLPIGRRVLIERDRGDDVIGNLVAARADSLFVELQPLGEVRAVPLPRVRGLLVSQSVPEPMILHGALIGAAIGAAFIFTLTGDPGPAVGGFGLGAFVGGVLGGDVRRERWRRVR